MVLSISRNVSIDESAFKTHTMRRTRGWGHPKVSPPQLKHPLYGVKVLQLLGPAVAMEFSTQVIYSLCHHPWKRKLDLDTPKQKPLKGTTRRHFMLFLLDLIFSLDKSSKFKNCYLVMDNCSIHKGPVVERPIDLHGYLVLYLPPYSPELNPIEQFGHLVKSQLKKQDFTKESWVEMTRKESVSIPRFHCKNIVQHSVNQFEQCIRKEPL